MYDIYRYTSLASAIIKIIFYTTLYFVPVHGSYGIAYEPTHITLTSLPFTFSCIRITPQKLNLRLVSKLVKTDDTHNITEQFLGEYRFDRQDAIYVYFNSCPTGINDHYRLYCFVCENNFLVQVACNESIVIEPIFQNNFFAWHDYTVTNALKLMQSSGWERVVGGCLIGATIGILGFGTFHWYIKARNLHYLYNNTQYQAQKDRSKLLDIKRNLYEVQQELGNLQHQYETLNSAYFKLDCITHQNLQTEHSRLLDENNRLKVENRELRNATVTPNAPNTPPAMTIEDKREFADTSSPLPLSGSWYQM